MLTTYGEILVLCLPGDTSSLSSWRYCPSVILGILVLCLPGGTAPLLSWGYQFSVILSEAKDLRRWQTSRPARRSFASLRMTLLDIPMTLLDIPMALLDILSIAATTVHSAD